jgi:hypothetical protein
MFVFGHLGIGRTLARPIGRGLPITALLLGTLLPDLIDKPVYYALSWMHGLQGADLGLISGTRTFGHTGIFLMLLLLLGFGLKSKWISALALGVSTHLLIDCLGDRWLNPGQLSSGVMAVLFPYFDGQFGAAPFVDIQDHATSMNQPYFWATEIIGFLLLFRERWPRILGRKKAQIR